ncbi:hypothetical protein [Sphingomonas sp.]|uniref:Npun_F0296 family exosortase-dependent surface protein n=1 Tax=Sphingomonas sp. TaxID=28214 RepID=UPI002DBC0AF7|nr:hypothetical protein [Sphingomonas sp.]HEU4967762.1 hypothetical protein [Sphingomonas sp.]
MMKRVWTIVMVALAAGVAMPAAAWVTVHVETSPERQQAIAAGSQALDDAGVDVTFTGFGSTGTDAYATTESNATLKLDRTAGYLSFRTGALDGSDTMELFSHGQSLGYYNLVDSAAAAGFGGDPARYSGLYRYVNFWVDEGIDEVRFSQNAGSFAFDQVRVGQLAAVTAVPEVQTWAMLILGFGVMGTAFRMQRRRLRTA